MANATVTITLQIQQAIADGGLQWRLFPNTFQATVVGSQEPAPGGFKATVAGVDVDLSQVATPGFCVFKNMDQTNFVEYGVNDGSEFVPLGELGPGEFYLIKLSRNFGVRYATSGTGVIAGTMKLHMRANTAPCNVAVEAFLV